MSDGQNGSIGTRDGYELGFRDGYARGHAEGVASAKPVDFATKMQGGIFKVIKGAFGLFFLFILGCIGYALLSSSMSGH